MTRRYNPPPNWPSPPAGWTAPGGWQPDPTWGPPPDGWQIWIEDEASKPWVKRHKVLTGLLGLAIVVAVGSAFSGDGDKVTTAPAAQGATTTKSDTPSTDAAADAAKKRAKAEAKAKEEAEAKAKAAAEKKAEAAAQKKAEAEAAAKAEKAKRAAAALKNPSNYAKVSARKFALIAKNPDDYAGKRFVVYGLVTQFDAATGEDTFRADTGPQAFVEDWYNYDVNAVVTGSKRMLRNVVQDDIVRMYVTSAGSYSYDTQIGGNTTVPLFKVNMIKVIGSADI